MPVIYKYPIEIADEQELLLPEGAVILGVQVVLHTPCIYAKVEPNTTTTTRKLVMYGTGHHLRRNHQTQKFIGSFQLMEGKLVYHLFEQN